MIVYSDGKLLPEKKVCVSITDHGFLYGDGVYETIRVYKGKPFLLSEHLRRLNNSMLGIRLSPPMSLIHLGVAIQKTIDANKHSDAVVRLTVTRGSGDYGFDPSACAKPTVIIASNPVRPYPVENYKKGILAAVVSVRRNSAVSLPPSIKSTSCLNGILAKMEAMDLAAQEGIMLTHDNLVAEGTVSNVFIVNKGRVLTPKIEGDLLPGVTRNWVCRLAREAGYEVWERRLPVSEIGSADEVFLTSTIMEIMPVSRIVLNFNKQKRQFRLGPYSKTSGYVGPITLDLTSRFKESVKRFERL